MYWKEYERTKEEMIKEKLLKSDDREDNEKDSFERKRRLETEKEDRAEREEGDFNSTDSQLYQLYR